ncbi:hypothetical protein [Treponema phagedenis]|uniref:hypothetical protein n=1 Tax=Treponema phagedenis TaxID=162 RepID=UPI0011E888E6|nr:hypothetical protein [Treponema phagedenis]QEK06881.1 hypothetical protein FUT80_09275 [Treponema phagedenis]
MILQTFEGDVYFAKIIPPEVNTVDSFSAFIAQSLPERQKIIAARNTIRKAEGTEKALAIDDFLQIVYASSSPRYDSLRTQVIEADPNNQTGLRGKYLFQIANIKAEAFIRVNDLISAGDAYKEAAESEFLTAEQKQSLWYQAAYTYAVSEKIATGEIIDYLRKAIAVYPQGERVNQIKQVIKKLLNTKSN